MYLKADGTDLGPQQKCSLDGAAQPSPSVLVLVFLTQQCSNSTEWGLCAPEENSHATRGKCLTSWNTLTCAKVMFQTLKSKRRKQIQGLTFLIQQLWGLVVCEGLCVCFLCYSKSNYNQESPRRLLTLAATCMTRLQRIYQTVYSCLA